MGEIKSTLDLVMERTRHLSLSDEERSRQQRADFEKRLHGLLQQYADEILSVTELLQRIETLRDETRTKDGQIVVEAVCRRLDPDADNNKTWTAVLERLVPERCRPLDDLLSRYREQKAGVLLAEVQKHRERLARDHAIHGSAVVPNPERDEDGRKKLAALHRDALAQIQAGCRQTARQG